MSKHEGVVTAAARHTLGISTILLLSLLSVSLFGLGALLFYELLLVPWYGLPAGLAFLPLIGFGLYAGTFLIELAVNHDPEEVEDADEEEQSDSEVESPTSAELLKLTALATGFYTISILSGALVGAASVSVVPGWVALVVAGLYPYLDLTLGRIYRSPTSLIMEPLLYAARFIRWALREVKFPDAIRVIGSFFIESLAAAVFIVKRASDALARKFTGTSGSLFLREIQLPTRRGFEATPRIPR